MFYDLTGSKFGRETTMGIVCAIVIYCTRIIAPDVETLLRRIPYTRGGGRATISRQKPRRDRGGGETVHTVRPGRARRRNTRRIFTRTFRVSFLARPPDNQTRTSNRTNGVRFSGNVNTGDRPKWKVYVAIRIFKFPFASIPQQRNAT